MTAINVLLGPAAAYVLTDGAVFDLDLKMVGVINKVFPFPHLGAVLAMRGPVALAMPVSLAVYDKARSWGTLRSTIIETCQRVWQAPFAEEVRKASGFHKADFVVAGLQADGRPSAYCFHTETDGETPPWTAQPIEELFVSPGTPEIVDRAVQGTGTPQDQLLAIMEDQRTSIGYVGGFAQLTTVAADGIHTRILRRWPNRSVQGAEG